MNTASVLGRDAEKLRSELRTLKAREVELESSLLEAGGQLASAKEDCGGKDKYIQEMSATHRAVLAKMRLGQEKLGKESGSTMPVLHSHVGLIALCKTAYCTLKR